MARIRHGKVFGYIAYTEQGENHGSVILDGVCHSAIYFGRVILSSMVEPFRSVGRVGFGASG